MPFSLHFDAPTGVATVTYAGIVPPEELLAALLACRDLIAERKSTRVLADCRTMSGGHSMVDVYLLFERYKSLGLPLGLREAVLLPELPAQQDNVRFYEDVGCNRGFNVRLFSDRTAAIEWLLA